MPPHLYTMYVCDVSIAIQNSEPGDLEKKLWLRFHDKLNRTRCPSARTEGYLHKFKVLYVSLSANGFSFSLFVLSFVQCNRTFMFYVLSTWHNYNACYNVITICLITDHTCNLSRKKCGVASQRTWQLNEKKEWNTNTSLID